jgi:hypothetical protein
MSSTKRTPAHPAYNLPEEAAAVAAAEEAVPTPAVAEAVPTVAVEAATAAAEAAGSGFGGAVAAAVAMEAIGAGGQATAEPGAINIARSPQSEADARNTGSYRELNLVPAGVNLPALLAISSMRLREARLLKRACSGLCSRLAVVRYWSRCGWASCGQEGGGKF